MVEDLSVTEETVPEIPVKEIHRIMITFANDSSVNLEFQGIMISVPQMELAGHFLIRQAELMYRKQQEINAARQIVPVPLGAIDPRHLRG